MVASLVEQIADLRPEQRATLDRLRIRVEGSVPVVEVTWMGILPTVASGSEVQPGVTAASWVKAAPGRLELDPARSIEDQVAELADSGIVGTVVGGRINESGDAAPRWSVQAWVGADGKVLAVSDTSAAMAAVLAADADLRLARWRTRQAETLVHTSVVAALSEGARAAVVATALGVTQARVYQIRDGRR